LAEHFPKFRAIAGPEFSRSYSPTQHLCENLKLILFVSLKPHVRQDYSDKGFMTTVLVGRYRNINQTAATCSYVRQSSYILEPTLLQNVRASNRGKITRISDTSSRNPRGRALHRAPISHEDCKSVHPVVVYHIDTDLLTPWSRATLT
jgi:hypothetical protein